jgi:serine/threonine-protein kinase HipA
VRRAKAQFTWNSPSSCVPAATPNIEKSDHVLNIDDQDNRPRLATVAATSAFYGLSAAQARNIIDKVVAVVDHWQDAARNAGISGADIDITSAAFAARAGHHAGARG